MGEQRQMKDKPIGILDSGLGGLTVVKEVLRQLPNEEIIYFGDNFRCPYGPRPSEEVKQFTLEIVEFLLKYDVKMIIIACNTATSAALETVRELVDIPVIGVILPGSLTAIKKTKTGKIGVIGTLGTIASGLYEKTLSNINPNLEITSLACPTLVPLVEDGPHSDETIRAVVKEALSPIIDKEMDSLILGCTHYPIISDYIQEVMGDEVNLLSSAEETAREASAILHYHNMMANPNSNPKHIFYTTGDVQQFRNVGEKWLNRNIDVIHVDI